MSQQINLDENQYFMSLPTYIQESIKQSGIVITSEEQLKQCVENLKEWKE